MRPDITSCVIKPAAIYAEIANPLATNMPHKGEHARHVVQLFADIFTDALQCAAARAVIVVRFVMDQRARESAGNALSLGFYFFFVGRR